MKQQTHIIAPPPTPNGDLHVGHLSGPYLAADIYRRYLTQQGVTANYVISADDNQSYVETTAKRLGIRRDQLIARSREQILHTLQNYSIGVQLFGTLDHHYERFITDYFRRIFDKKLINVRQTEVLFDTKNGTYPVEAHISGNCPTCLQKTCGGICESCGHPNQCIDLLNLNQQGLEIRQEPRLVLDLERFRPSIEAFLRQRPNRPRLQYLINSLLEKKLTPFVLSYKTGHGISAEFAELADQQINVWAEMYPGHLYFLQQASKTLSANDQYVQFLGFDNSYFYVLVHVALMFAAKEVGLDWPAPTAFITNQFYHLDSVKFSTSKGHVLWAIDLAKKFNSDLIRLYLALNGPEYQEANFIEDDFEQSAQAIAGGINQLVRAYNQSRNNKQNNDLNLLNQLTAAMATILPLESYSSQILAKQAIHCIQFVGQELMNGNTALRPFVPNILVLCLEIFCPKYSDALRLRFQINGTGWQQLTATTINQDIPEFEVLA